MLVSTTKDIYPSLEQLARKSSFQYVPPSLRLLLLKMFSGVEAEKKTASIGQTVVQAVHPRAIMATLQIGLTVQLHQHFRSKYLIDTLHALGFRSVRIQ